MLTYNTDTLPAVSDGAIRSCWGWEVGVDEDADTGAASQDERITAIAQSPGQRSSHSVTKLSLSVLFNSGFANFTQWSSILNWAWTCSNICQHIEDKKWSSYICFMNICWNYISSDFFPIDLVAPVVTSGNSKCCLKLQVPALPALLCQIYNSGATVYSANK